MEINSTNIRELIELLEDYLSYVDEKDGVEEGEIKDEVEDGVEEEGDKEEGKAKVEAFLEAINETLGKRSKDDDDFDKAIDKIAKGD